MISRKIKVRAMAAPVHTIATPANKRSSAQNVLDLGTPPLVQLLHESSTVHSHTMLVKKRDLVVRRLMYDRDGVRYSLEVGTVDPVLKKRGFASCVRIHILDDAPVLVATYYVRATARRCQTWF